MTVDEIEKRTGLIIWAGLPDDVQASLKSKPGVLPELMAAKLTKTRRGGFIFHTGAGGLFRQRFCAAASSRCRGDATA